MRTSQPSWRSTSGGGYGQPPGLGHPTGHCHSRPRASYVPGRGAGASAAGGFAAGAAARASEGSAAGHAAADAGQGSQPGQEQGQGQGHGRGEGASPRAAGHTPEPRPSQQAGSGGGQAPGYAAPRWDRSPYAVLFGVAHANVAEPLPIGPPAQPHRDVQLLVELQGAPVEQRRSVVAQLLSEGHPLSRVARAATVRHIDADNAAMIVQCHSAPELEAVGIDVVTEAARWRSGEGLEVQVEGPNGGRPARVRLPVRAVPSERPPGHATVKVMGLTPMYALTGLTEVLLGCAGYVLSDDAVPRVASEHMAPFKPANGIGKSDMVVAWVACPPDDPTLRRLPRQFSMGSLPAKIEVIPAQESIGSVGPAWAFAPRHGVYPMDEDTGTGMGAVPGGLGARVGGGGRAPEARAAQGGRGPGVSSPAEGGDDPMHVDPPGSPTGASVPRASGAGGQDAAMADAAGAPEAARSVHPPGVYTAQERQAWSCTYVGQRWERAITRATDDEQAEEGVDAAEVMAAFFARFASGAQGVDVWAWGEGQALPEPVRGWLREEGYVQSYGDSSSSSSGSSSDEEEAPNSGGGGPSRARERAPRPGQQQPAPRGAAPAGSAGSPGSRQGRGSSQSGTSQVPQSEEASLRRSTRERRQAHLPSELPESLAASGRASGVSAPGPGASARPPNPSAEGGGRRP